MSQHDLTLFVGKTVPDDTLNRVRHLINGVWTDSRTATRMRSDVQVAPGEDVDVHINMDKVAIFGHETEARIV